MPSINRASLVLAAAAGLALASGAGARGAAAPGPAGPGPAGLQGAEAQVSYAIGLKIGADMRNKGAAIDPAILADGLRDGLSGAAPKLTEAQIKAAVAQMQGQLAAGRLAAAAKASAANQAEGAAFLEANAAKPGVVRLASGLEYQILAAGKGPRPTLADTVSCNYRGTLLNGKEFDSSYDRGTPADFPVTGVIKGWTQALQLMPVGSKWRLFVPASLAYGDEGAGADIGPGATLIFEVELLAIKGAG